MDCVEARLLGQQLVALGPSKPCGQMVNNCNHFKASIKVPQPKLKGALDRGKYTLWKDMPCSFFILEVYNHFNFKPLIMEDYSVLLLKEWTVRPLCEARVLQRI